MLYTTKTAIAILALGHADAFGLGGPCAVATIACRAPGLTLRAELMPPAPAGFVWADDYEDSSPASASAASSGEMSIEQACTFMYANDDVSITEKAAYLKSKGVSDFVIAQSTCCSMLDRFGAVSVSAEPKPVAAEPKAVAAEPKPVAAEPKPKAKPAKREAWKQGLFAPGVLAAKALLGEQELKELRASVITKHSKVIADFVDTSESKFGQLVLRRMFEYADKDGNGTLDREEVKAALLDLGFDFLNEKQVSTLLMRADADKNEVIDFEEFVASTPKALRTSLVKLAKKNGHDLGFLV